MKKALLLTLICGAAGIVCAEAQSKLNNVGKMLVNELRMQPGTRSTGGTHIDMLAQLNGDMGDAVAQLEALGVIVNWGEDGLAAISVPLEALEAIGALDCVEALEYSRPLRPMLDFARPSGTVSEAQEGFTYEGATHKYTGAGILTSLMDTGIEPNHINFKDASGNTRVKAVYGFTESSGTCQEYTTPQQIAGYTTDNSRESHGTHVCGIMSGSYNGPGTYAYTKTPSSMSATVVNDGGSIPYYGVATGSSVAMAGGTLTTNNITTAITKLASLGAGLNLPTVINLSLGSNDGPHDGSSLLCKAMTSTSKKAIICVAAGNEGEYNLFINKTFTASDGQVKTFISDNQADGVVDIWGADATPFRVTWALFATSSGKLTEVCAADGSTTSSSSSGSSLFRSNFSGSIIMESGVDNRNHRFNVASMVKATPLTTDYKLSLIVEGTNGTTVYIYGEPEVTFTNGGLSGWTKGSRDGSINDMACADGVVVVGAYTSRTSWPEIDGSAFRYSDSSMALDKISPFSSWGETFQGVKLPHVCAPGANIISSYNRFNVTASGLSSTMTAKASNGSATDWWGAMQGTSMACPYAAGVIALWLEADPTLTSAEVLDVIAQTSVSQSSTTGGGLITPGTGSSSDDDRWGAGKIDAVAGLKYVLSHSGVGTVISDDKGVIIEQSEGIVCVTAPAEASVKASLYTLGGAMALAAEGRGEATLNTSPLASGVYLLRVVTPTTILSRKVAIR